MKNILYICLIICPLCLLAQKEDYNWSFGQGYSFDSVTNVINFNTQPPTINAYAYPISAQVSFRRNTTCISDSNGNFLFASNGLYVIDKNLDTMQNGMGLNQNGFSATDLNPKSSIILPSLTNKNEYYLLYYLITPNGPNTGYPLKLLYSKIDMSLNNGAVVQKNITILTDNIAPWSLQAVRHANGRDWWILCPKRNSNLVHKLLLSPSGLQNIGAETTGYITPNTNICAFSPDGNKYIQYLADDSKLRIHNFNRCTGELKGYTDLITPIFPTLVPSICVSPNSRYLYLNNGVVLVQYDLEALDIKATEDTIAVRDTFSNNVGFQVFDAMQLAPDGKIYMASGTLDYLHVINNPDSAGAACNFVQRQIQLPVSSMGLPNLPNFRLGREVGSACDTVYTSIIKEEGIRKEVRVYPNPATDKLYISIAGIKEPLTVLLINTLGQEVARYALAQEEQEISLANLPKGVYYCRVLGREGVYFAAKVVKE
jgi:hypothetical protein